MKSPRLIPVVIAATTALLILKGIGLLTTGSYVLTGTSVAVAEGGGHTAASGGAEAQPGSTDPTMALPQEATMTDTAPVLDDKSATMPLTDPAAAHGEAAATAEAAPADPAAAPADTVPADGGFVAQQFCPREEPVLDANGHTVAQPDATASGAAPGAAPAPADASAHGATPADAAAASAAATPNCIPDPGTNAQGDALALIKNAKGEIVPLSQESAGSEPAVLQRLGERRDNLDAREAELAAREDLLKAAEKQLDDRTAELKAIEEKVNALVEEKKSAEQQQFTSIVAMYEQMKPKDAATIFNELETPLLIKVASAMNPKKMGPILAKMDPLKAKALTDGMAAQQAEQNGGDLTGADLANLPQIVGK
ncbi:MotE family protein [Devosia sp.]|uniref:MotE family protein n=1 Tax=Devosia sp. TaxID=1871048 RepID=UPI003BAB795C